MTHYWRAAEGWIRQNLSEARFFGLCGPEMEKVQAAEMMETRIEGYEPAAGVLRKSCEIGVCPAARRKILGLGIGRKLNLHIGRFAKENDLRQSHEVAIDFPRLWWGEWTIPHNLRVGGQTEQSEHRDATERKSRSAFAFPILPGPRVMLVILATEREPDVNVRQVSDWHERLPRQGFRLFENYRAQESRRRWIDVQLAESCGRGFLARPFVSRRAIHPL